jgi:NAD(P)-dependent dehydrogenase (short-subunit alcohol dehydrogenase family)
MIRLQDKAVIVTGSGFGIGQAIAVECAREGAKVVVTDIREKGVTETVALIEAEAGTAVGVVGDISNPAIPLQLVETCLSHFGQVDSLINNAANQTTFPLEEVTDEHWDLLMAINVTSMMRLARAASPHLPSNGSIVNLASLVGDCPIPGRLAYNTTKTAIMGLTRALAVELGVRGIRVNSISPGHIMSVGEEEWNKRVPERDKRIFASHYALCRVGKTTEVAKAAVFLASDDASFITGVNLRVDGGMGMLSPETASFRAAEAVEALYGVEVEE